MADPLSITASAIAVGTVITGTIKAIEKINNLPQAIKELLEEVTELNLVLCHVDSFIRSTSSQLQPTWFPEFDARRVSEIVGRLRSTLNEVDELLQKHVVQCPTPVGEENGNFNVAEVAPGKVAMKGEKNPIKINWVSGKKTLLRISTLRKTLESIGRSLVLTMSVISGARSAHLEQVIHELLHVARISHMDQRVFFSGHKTHFQQLRDTVDTLSQDVEASLSHTVQFTQIKANLTQNSHMNINIDRPGGLIAMESRNSGILSPDLENQLGHISLRNIHRQRQVQYLSRRRLTHCSPTCICTCHMRRSLSTNSSLNPIFGTLNIDMVASLATGGKCSERSCEIRGPAMLNLEYIFPLWFLMMLITISIQAPRLSNLTLNIRAARIRPDSSLLFRFAMEGNADGIRDLFNKGLASPFDVDASTRTSALVYATGWHHPKVWKLLLEAGADPYQESNTRHSPMVNVWRSLLEAGFVQKTLGQPTEKEAARDDKLNMPEEVLMALKGDFDLEEYMERRQFPILHQIVMGLVEADLETQLKLSTAEIDKVDQQGLTALSWAATTGDTDSVEKLLRYGADPNLVAFNGDMALHYAVRTVNPGCIETLIRCNADVDAQNAWAVTPLHYATMNRDDLRHVIPLVEVNANVDLVDQHGRTPLFRAVKYDRPNIVRYLLEHKAQLLVDKWGQHPLDQALDSGFHEVLKIILTEGRCQLTTDQLTASLSRAEELEDQFAIELLKGILFEISQKTFVGEDPFVSTEGVVMEEKLAFEDERG